jgi:hypothetical protein
VPEDAGEGREDHDPDNWLDHLYAVVGFLDVSTHRRGPVVIKACVEFVVGGSDYGRQEDSHDSTANLYEDEPCLSELR